MTTKYPAAAVLAVACQMASPAQNKPVDEVAHERTAFRFTVDLTYAMAAPLFGAWAEQKWAPDWKPQFLYPNPPEDREGAVFRVESGPSHSAVWMTTVFDLAAGHVQHVYVLNHAVMTRIDIHLAKNGETKTDVAVAYEWTALDPAANQHVKHLAATEGETTAREWRDAINAYGARVKASK
jgi:hypothetical protein